MRTFSFFIHTAASSTPTLEFELAGDEVSLRCLAERALRELPHRLAVEIREDDRLVFSLDRNGTTWPVHRPDTLQVPSSPSTLRR